MEPDLVALAAFAERLADAAGRVILPYFRAEHGLVDKGAGAFDPVTEADRGAEAAIRRLIKERYPAHGILGEEFGQEAGTSPLTWVLDPVDGTRAFIAGLPMWGTLIALNDGTRPLLGVLDQPFLRERFVGHSGASYLTGPGGRERCRVRDTRSLNRAILCATTPDMFTPGEERGRFERVARQARLVRYGTDCYAYGMLALGHVDLVIEAGLKPYDIQAHIPIIEGAGGMVTDWDGGPAFQGGACIAAATPELHAEALGILNA